MSATRDTQSKIGWSFSNIYHIFKDKSEVKPVVTAFEPLKNNLQKLNELHDRLKVMIQELEDSMREK